MATGKEIRRGQTSKRQSCTIGPATNWLLFGLEASSANRFLGLGDNIHSLGKNFTHIAIRFLDDDVDSTTRLFAHQIGSELPQQILGIEKALASEIAHDELDPGLLDASVDVNGMKVSLSSFGCFRGEAVLWETVDQARGKLQAVYQFSLGIAWMNVASTNLDDGTIRAERFPLDCPGR